MPVKPPDSANRFDEAQNSEWRECVVCGTRSYIGIVYFDSGSVAPTVGETITGATSGNTGVIGTVWLRSGSYAGGDAAGVIELSSPTGYERENYTMFSDNELLNGSTSGSNMSTVNGTGSVSINGVLYPQKDMVEYKGKYYCQPHFLYRFRQEWAMENEFKSSLEKNRSFD